MSKINAEVNNLDIRGLLERVDRARYEVLKAGSANIDDIRQADRNRIDTYNSEIVSYAAYIAAEPEQDYPESYPEVYEVNYMVTEDMEVIENLGLRDLDALYKKFVVELSNSQSARYPSGIKLQDKARVDSYMQRIDSLLTNHLDAVNPLDLPETNPSEASITDGKLGI
jgi:GTP1/Obg family GTP-binding protein